MVNDWEIKVKQDLTLYNMMGYYRWILGLKTDINNKNEIILFLKYEYRHIKDFFNKDILHISSYEEFVKERDAAYKNRKIKLFVNELPRNFRELYTQGKFSENLKDLCHLCYDNRLGFLYRVSKYKSMGSDLSLFSLEKELYDFIYGSLLKISSMDQLVKTIENMKSDNWRVVYKNEISGIVLFAVHNEQGVGELASDSPWCTKSSNYFYDYVTKKQGVKYIAIMDYTRDKHIFNNEIGLEEPKPFFEKIAFVYCHGNDTISTAFNMVNQPIRHTKMYTLIANKIPKRDLEKIFGKVFVKRLEDGEFSFDTYSINKWKPKSSEQSSIEEPSGFYKLFLDLYKLVVAYAPLVVFWIISILTYVFFIFLNKK